MADASRAAGRLGSTFHLVHPAIHFGHHASDDSLNAEGQRLLQQKG